MFGFQGHNATPPHKPKPNLSTSISYWTLNNDELSREFQNLDAMHKLVYDGTVILHDDGREFQRYPQFLTEGDEEV